MNAIMYNTIFGEVMRCTLAGIDAKGHAQWVIVSPGLKPVTLDDYLADHDLTGETFRVLCLEDEQADSLTVAKLLGERMQNPLYDLHTELSNCLRELDRLGVSVDTEPLSLNFTVRRVEEKSMRSGRYYFRIEAERLDAGYIGRTICTVCGEVVDPGTPAPALGGEHNLQQVGDIESSSYVNSDGETIYFTYRYMVCTRCGYGTTETLEEWKDGDHAIHPSETGTP